MDTYNKRLYDKVWAIAVYTAIASSLCLIPISGADAKEAFAGIALCFACVSVYANQKAHKAAFIFCLCLFFAVNLVFTGLGCYFAQNQDVASACISCFGLIVISNTITYLLWRI